MNNNITIKMIETAINKGIRDIEDNPKRGIRNLVDLANHFASSPFQKDVLELMQTMLSDLNSPYYNIVLDLINNVDHNTIKNFGINLGYNSWTYGAKKIREHTKIHNYSVPWTIIFDFRKESDEKLNIQQISSIIQQGKEIGIYTYLFFMDDINDFSTIAKENLDCAFTLFAPANILTEESIYKIKSYNNTVFAVLYEASVNPDVFKKTIQLLSKNNCMFGLYSYYNNENFNDILEDKWTNEIIDNNSPFGILIESKNCKKKNASLIHDYVFNSKTNQEHSTFLIDLYEDIGRINRNISKETCIFTIMGNGDAYSYKFPNKKNINIKNILLTEVLSKIS